MKKIKIEGGHTLTGEIVISGAKNSAVALVPASLLCDGEVIIDNIPNISDIEALNEILEYLGASVVWDKETEVMKIDARNVDNKEIPEVISKKLRASYYFMAALLGKYKKVEMYFPGGCAIGARPIDQTLKAFELLGATVVEEENRYTITANVLKGCHIYLDMPSVGATINTILASVLAEGETILENAAKEPEIVNVVTFLNQMGANITGAGTSEIHIVGVRHLGSCFTEVIPDRIETGTYVLAGALMGDHLRISNVIPGHVEALLLKLKEMGVPLEIGADYIVVSAAEKLKAISVKTLGYPGFATDLQQPLAPLLCLASGTSNVEETIYENRTKHTPYLNQMGASIQVEGRNIKITGPSKLVGTSVVATDLRAGASLVLAGLKAEGETLISEVDHILRGYENMIEKLSAVGAKIELIEI